MTMYLRELIFTRNQQLEARFDAVVLYRKSEDSKWIPFEPRNADETEMAGWYPPGIANKYVPPGQVLLFNLQISTFLISATIRAAEQTGLFLQVGNATQLDAHFFFAARTDPPTAEVKTY